jgi:hypothetical protein
MLPAQTASWTGICASILTIGSGDKVWRCEAMSSGWLYQQKISMDQEKGPL